MESDKNEDKNKYLDKLKVVSISNEKSRSSKEYPTLNLTIRDGDKPKTYAVTSKLIFGDTIGSSVPFFIFNLCIKKIYEYFNILISKISDEILLENIKLLNKTLKEVPNLIDDISKIKGFKNYLSTSFRFKSKSYEMYINLLKKLFLFSKSLFESILEEFRKYIIENKSKKKLDKVNIIEGTTFSELQNIDGIIRSNMEVIVDLLLKKIPVYDITSQTNYNNVYQIIDGALILSQSSVQLYERDYITDNKLFQERFKIGATPGNFYVLIKQSETDRDFFLGNFNSYVKCVISKKKKGISEILSCKNRNKLLKNYFEKVTYFKGKGGSRRRRNGKKTRVKLK
jgi:hypothetical protein